MPPAKNEEPVEDVVDLSEVDGFHVMRGKEHFGTYGSEPDAQAFIDSHLDGKGTIFVGVSE